MMDLRLQALIDYGLLSEETVASCQMQEREALVEAILREGHVSEEDYLEVISKTSGFAPCRLDMSNILQSSLKFYAEILHQYSFLPLYEKNGELVIGISDPFDLTALDDLRLVLGGKIAPVIVNPRALKLALQMLVPLSNESIEAASKNLHSLLPVKVEREDEVLLDDYDESSIEVSLDDIDVDLDALVDEAHQHVSKGISVHDTNRLEDIWDPSVASACDAILRWGWKINATRVYLENRKGQFKIRVLANEAWVQAENSPPLSFTPSTFVDEVKTMAHMDILDQSPQWGLIAFATDKGERFAKIFTLPAEHGEELYIDYEISNDPLSYTDLQIPGDINSELEELLQGSPGLLLTTGPRKSGISTTLYALAEHFFSADKKLIVLDPSIPHLLPTATHLSGNFHSEEGILKTALSHSPDAVVLGDIRDSWAMRQIIPTIERGVWILATMPSNISFQSLDPLLLSGLPIDIIVSALRGILDQRILRLLCSECKCQKQSEVIGCPACSSSGYQKQRAIFQAAFFHRDTRRKLIEAKDVEGALRDYVQRQFCSRLREEALQLVQRGETSAEEVASVLQM